MNKKSLIIFLIVFLFNSLFIKTPAFSSDEQTKKEASLAIGRAFVLVGSLVGVFTPLIFFGENYKSYDETYGGIPFSYSSFEFYSGKYNNLPGSEYTLRIGSKVYYENYPLKGYGWQLYRSISHSETTKWFDLIYPGLEFDVYARIWGNDNQPVNTVEGFFYMEVISFWGWNLLFYKDRNICIYSGLGYNFDLFQGRHIYGIKPAIDIKIGQNITLNAVLFKSIFSVAGANWEEFLYKEKLPNVSQYQFEIGGAFKFIPTFGIGLRYFLYEYDHNSNGLMNIKYSGIKAFLVWQLPE